MTTVVYKVSGPFTSNVYYGYSQSGTEMETFLTGGARPDGERGDRRMLVANEGSVDTLTVAFLGEFEDEYDAWCMRNDCRANDACSITGPTMFPVGTARRAKQEQPERVARWWAKRPVYATARAAYEANVYTFAQISALCAQHGRDVVMHKLNTQSPADFTAEFGL